MQGSQAEGRLRSGWGSSAPHPMAPVDSWWGGTLHNTPLAALSSHRAAPGLSLHLAWGSEQRGPARAQGQTLPFIFHFSFLPVGGFFHQLHPALLAHPCWLQSEAVILVSKC